MKGLAGARHRRSARLCAGGACGHEGPRRGRQEGRRAHLVRRALHVGGCRGSGARLHRDVRRQGRTSCARRRRSPTSACCRTSRTTRRSATSSPRPTSATTCAWRPRAGFEKYAPETESKIAPDASATSTPPASITRPRPAWSSSPTTRTKVKAEEAPKKWQDLLDIKWKGKVSIGHPGLLGLCRHLGADDEEPLRLELLRQAREEQAADRPLDQRHGDGAQCRRATGGGGRRRLDPVQRLARQSAGGVLSDATARC